MPVGPDPHLPPLLLATFALQLVAAILAVFVARKRTDHFPVAVFLLGMFVAAAIRWVLLTWYVQPCRASYPGIPLTGAAVRAAHADTALFLGWPAGIAGMAVRVYMKRRPWIVLAVWAAASIAIAAAYPLTRGDVLRKCYLAAELAALLVSFGSIGMWARHRESVTLPRACVLLIVLFELATLLGPWIGDPFRDWYKAQILYCMLDGGLVALQGGSSWLRSSRSE